MSPSGKPRIARCVGIAQNTIPTHLLNYSSLMMETILLPYCGSDAHLPDKS